MVFGTLASFLVIFGKFGTVGTFSTPAAFGTLTIGSVLSTLGTILSEFWYIWCTLVYLTFGTPVGTLYTSWYIKWFFWYTKVLFTLDGNDKGLRGHSKKICKPRFNTDIRKYFFLKSSH